MIDYCTLFSRNGRLKVAMPDKMQLVKEFAAALLAVALAWALRLVLEPALAHSAPFITFFPMMFLLAWWGGFRPTLFGVILSTLLLAYAILEPIGSFRI